MITLNKYADNIDKCWYDSSNVIYSECDDKVDDFKSVKVVFKDGRTYLYEGVPVNNYLLFRSSASQGKDLFKYIALKVNGVEKFKTTRLENTDLAKLESDRKLILEERELERQKLLVESENSTTKDPD